jgi:hypothetical protein
MLEKFPIFDASFGKPLKTTGNQFCCRAMSWLFFKVLLTPVHFTGFGSAIHEEGVTRPAMP